MKTERFKVRSNGDGMEAALDAAENFAREVGLDEKNSCRVRLLAEETMSMVRSIVEDFEADFWLEENASKCTLHLTAETFMTIGKKRRLIDASTDKKNAASVGIMGKIRDIIEMGFGTTDTMYMSMGGIMTMQPDVYLWSLDNYRQDIKNASDDDSQIAEALDELEKSIVANIADDVRVAVRGNNIEMVIEKSFA